MTTPDRAEDKHIYDISSLARRSFLRGPCWEGKNKKG